jgi:hypothetical protein
MILLHMFLHGWYAINLVINNETFVTILRARPKFQGQLFHYDKQYISWLDFAPIQHVGWYSL